MSILWEQIPDDSRRVMGVLKVTQSALMRQEQVCSGMNAFACKRAQPICSDSHQLPSEAADLLRAGPSKTSLPTLGFKGVLHNAAQAVAAGKGKAFMEDFLTNHPESVKQLTGTLAERIKTLWKPATTTRAPTPAPTPAPIATTTTPSVVWRKDANRRCGSGALIMLAAGSSLQDCQSRCVEGCSGVYFPHSVYSHLPVDCHVCRGDPNLRSDITYDYYQKVTPTVSPPSIANVATVKTPIDLLPGGVANLLGGPVAPWLIAGTGVCVAIICSGIAFGVCCHAQMTSRSRRREMGGALLAADRDMEVFASEPLTGAMPI